VTSYFDKSEKKVLLLQTHKKIARGIGQELYLKNNVTSSLVIGSVSPDSWRDYPHHQGGESKVKRRILNSRNCHLKNEETHCAIELGIAFHYVADRCVSGPSSREGWAHTNYERQIERCPLNGTSAGLVGRDETINYALKKSVGGNPCTDLSMAFEICLSVANSVFSSKFPSPNIRNMIDKAGENLKKHATKRVYFVWFLALILLGAGTFSILTLNPLIGMLVGLLTVIIEFFSLIIFPVGKFTSYQNIRHVHDVINMWKVLTIFLPSLFILLSYMFNVLLLSLLYCFFGYFLQWCCNFYLYYRSGADKVGTYIFWYLDWTTGNELN